MNNVGFALKFFSKRQLDNGIPNEHERDHRKKNVSPDPPLVAHGLVKHPKAAEVAHENERH